MEKKTIKKPLLILKNLQQSEKNYSTSSQKKEIDQYFQIEASESSRNREREEIICHNITIFPKEFSTKYEIIGIIGKGMQGVVYKIRDRKNRQILSAKIYCTRDEEKIYMIKKEAEILNAINHENIIQFKEFFQDFSCGCHVIVTEYFESIKIKDFLSKNEFSCETLNQVLYQIYDGMNYLHNEKIIHRDFNIDNILINPLNQKIKIIDFGLSRFHQNNQVQEFVSPEGNFKYRPPVLESLSNPYFEDVWNFAVIALSFLLREKMTTKKVCKLIEKPTLASKEEKSQIILKVLQNSINECCQLKSDDISISFQSPLKNFNTIFVK